MSAPTTPTAEAVARLTKYLDAVDESHRSPFQKSVSYTDHDAGTFAWEVFKVSDLRALLAAYADAARDREREVDVDALAVLACCRYNRMSGTPSNIAAIGELLAKQESTMMRWRETVECILNVVRPLPALAARTGEAR